MLHREGAALARFCVVDDKAFGIVAHEEGALSVVADIVDPPSIEFQTQLTTSVGGVVAVEGVLRSHPVSSLSVAIDGVCPFWREAFVGDVAVGIEVVDAAFLYRTPHSAFIGRGY